MYPSFIGALVFSFVFFGVWSLKDACNATAANCLKPLVIGVLFVLAGYIVTRIA